MAPFDGNTTAKEVAAAFASTIKGKTVLITGSSKGSLGALAAQELASKSVKHLILASRNEAKVTPVIEEIRKINPDVKIDFVQADLSSNESVRGAAAKINGLVGYIDIVINAAGNMALPTFQTSVDGNELQLAANHLGHFLLTSLILDKVLAAPTPIVVILTSMGYELGEFNFDDPNFNGGKTYGPWQAYAQAKTANILHTVALRQKFGDKGLVAFDVHPGYIPDTELQASNGVDADLMIEGFKLAVERNGGKEPPVTVPRTLQEGAATILVAALDSSIRDKSPALLVENNIYAAVRDYAINTENAEKLWALSEKLTQ